MKKGNQFHFLNWLGVFLVFHFGFHFLHKNWLMKQNQQAEKELNFNGLSSKPKVWFMGDSHPLLAIDPEQIPESFNWASRSENYILCYYKIKYLLERGHKPTIIFLPAEIHSLSSQGKSLIVNHELDDSWWANKISPFEADAAANGSDFRRWWLAANFASHAGQFYHLKFLAAQPQLGLTKLGFMPDSTDFSQNENAKEIINEKVKSHVGKFKLVDSLQIKYLNKTIQLLKESGIKLVLVKYPVSKPYFEAISERINPKLVDQEFVRLKDKVKILDFRNLYFGRPELFSDPDHLNQKGAEEFSQMFKEFSGI